MDTRLLCLADPNGRLACFLKAEEDGLAYVGGTPGSEHKIGAVLIDLLSRGVHVRVESFSQGRIDIDFRRIGPDDARYLDRCAAEFRTRGWLAQVYSQEVSRVWRKLHELPVTNELRLEIVGMLAYVPPETLAGLEGRLDEAAAGLRKLAAA
jgi:hypothetical protein